MIIAEDVILSDFLSEYLNGEGYKVHVTKNYKSAKKIIYDMAINIVLIDIPNIVKEDIIKVEKYSIEFNVFPIIITNIDNSKLIMEFIKKGIGEFVKKPIELFQLKIILEKVKTTLKLKNKVKTLSSFSEVEQAFNGILGSTPSMRRIFQDIKSVAKTSATVLITGETGTGKELIAHLIHDISGRDKDKLMTINCSSIPKELLESELFGYEKGAFTGAYNTKNGLFELSSGGTLFLDEIGDMDYALQAKLLRVLEEKKIRRLGSTKSIPIDFRLLTATNQDLLELVSKKQFRKDLYYRLNVFNIHLPTLQERKADIIPLAYYFLDKYNYVHQKNIRNISEEATLKLLNYDYKGNIRELEHIIEKAVITSNNIITEKNILFPREYIPLHEKGTDNININIEKPLKKVLEYWKNEIRKEYLINMIDKYGWDVETIIEMAKIERSYFYKLVKQFNIVEKNSTKWKKIQQNEK